MPGGKLPMPWPLCVFVGGGPAAPEPLLCPARLATGELPGPAWVPDPVEQAADKAAAATTRARAAQRPGRRRAGAGASAELGMELSSSRLGGRPVTRRDTPPAAPRRPPPAP